MKVHIVLLAVLISVIGPWRAGSARADFMLVPAGLNPGDQFRVVFLSSTMHDALSSNIADYDQFITNLAVVAGIDTYFGSPVTWQVLGSTSSVSAISRIPLTSPGLYLLNGDKVADSGADLWDGTINEGIFLDEKGFGHFDAPVFTGTLPDGSASISHPLGPGASITDFGFAFPTITDDRWIRDGIRNSADSAELYGVSSVLTVPAAAAVPEPASLTLVLAGLATLTGGTTVRRWPRGGAHAPVPPGG